MQKKWIACLLSAGLVLSLGCGQTASDAKAETAAAADTAGAADSAAADAGQTVYQVLSVEDSVLTVLAGTLSGNGQAPTDGQTPPDLPSGNGQAPTDGQTPPDLPSGSGQAPTGGGMAFAAASETELTVTVTEDTVITVAGMNGAEAGTLADITAGAVLEITFSSDSVAESILVRSLLAGQPPDGAGNGQGGAFGSDGTTNNGTAVTLLSEDTQISNAVYTSSGNDENALRVDGAAVTLTGVTVSKAGGASSNTENGDFYGMNAGVLACSGATLTVTGGTVTTSAVNGNGVFSYGSGTTVNITDTVIRTTERNSGGIQTTGGAAMNAYNLDVETEGASSAAIRSDRGGGNVSVTGGVYVTNGTGSPAIYSTAAIAVANATLTANASEAVVIEGKNSVALQNCTVSGNMQDSGTENVHGFMLYQSMSGDADVGQSVFSAEGSRLATLRGDLFYVTNTACVISLSNCVLTTANGMLLTVAGNDSDRGWGTAGANGGDCTLLAAAQTLEGDITVDAISSLVLTLSDGSTFTGAINRSGAAGTVELALNVGCTMTLTGDCYVTAFTGDIASIVTNGYHLYVNGVIAA